jgi:hypothetical protein
VKTVDLGKKRHSLAELLTLAKSETVLIRSASGDDFLLEQADEFEREARALGSSESFLSLLRERSQETGDIPIDEVREKRLLEE